MRSGIILSGGASTRIGQEKGLVKLKDKPLVSWVIDRIKDVTDEIIVVVGSEEDIPQYWAFVPDDVQVISDFYPEKSPLIGLISGLRKVKSQYAAICACDMPFLNPVILEMMFCISYGLNGALLVKPNGWIEPLPSVYNVTTCLRYAELLRRNGELRIRKVLENMSDVVRLPVEKLREIDPELMSFIDLDTIISVKNAESLIYKVT
jgi:molybdopterin-guanine dinucleotide biosynthesis protein A